MPGAEVVFPCAFEHRVDASLGRQVDHWRLHRHLELLNIVHAHGKAPGIVLVPLGQGLLCDLEAAVGKGHVLQPALPHVLDVLAFIVAEIVPI